MFPLGAGGWPETIDQLRERLAGGLRAFPSNPAFELDRLTLSGQWPEVSELALDLGGLDVDPMAFAVGVGQSVDRKAGPISRHVRIRAIPLRFRDLAKPEFELQANDVRFDFVRDDSGRHWLSPVKVGGGTARARITVADLDRLFLEAARQFARKQGITIEETRLRVEPTRSGSAVSAEAEIGARKAFLKGRIRAGGMIELTQALEIRLRDMKCEGLGAIGGLAARAAQPHLERLNGRLLRCSFFSGMRLEQCELRREGDALECNARLAGS